jgi:hypothetical protein
VEGELGVGRCADASHEQSGFYDCAEIVYPEALEDEAAQGAKAPLTREGGGEVYDVGLEVVCDDDVGAVLQVAVDDAASMHTFDDAQQLVKELRWECPVGVFGTASPLDVLDEDGVGVGLADDAGDAGRAAEDVVDALFAADKPWCDEGAEQPAGGAVILHHRALAAVFEQEQLWTRAASRAQSEYKIALYVCSIEVCTRRGMRVHASLPCVGRIRSFRALSLPGRGTHGCREPATRSVCGLPDMRYNVGNSLDGRMS